MEDEKLLAILRKLLQASKKFNVDWNTGKSTEVFKSVLGNSTVFIANIRDAYYLLINNEAGNEIGKLSGYAYEHELRELYELAKRKALKIDQTLNELDNLLDGLK